jgi:hypothetical protein
LEISNNAIRQNLKPTLKSNTPHARLEGIQVQQVKFFLDGCLVASGQSLHADIIFQGSG